MDIRLGKDAKVYRNSNTFASPTWVDVSDIVTNVTLGVSKTTWKPARRGRSVRQSVPTMLDISAEVSILHQPTNAQYQALRSAFVNDTAVDMMILSGLRTVANNDGLRGFAYIVEFGRDEPIEEGLVNKLKFEPALSDAGEEMNFYTQA